MFTLEICASSECWLSFRWLNTIHASPPASRLAVLPGPSFTPVIFSFLREDELHSPYSVAFFPFLFMVGKGKWASFTLFFFFFMGGWASFTLFRRLFSFLFMAGRGKWASFTFYFSPCYEKVSFTHLISYFFPSLWEGELHSPCFIAFSFYGRWGGKYASFILFIYLFFHSPSFHFGSERGFIHLISFVNLINLIWWCTLLWGEMGRSGWSNVREKLFIHELTLKIREGKEEVETQVSMTVYVCIVSYIVLTLWLPIKFRIKKRGRKNRQVID